MTLRGKYPDLCTVSLFLYVMVLKTISLGCGVWASLMLFLSPAGQGLGWKIMKQLLCCRDCVCVCVTFLHQPLYLIYL